MPLVVQRYLTPRPLLSPAGWYIALSYVCALTPIETPKRRPQAQMALKQIGIIGAVAFVEYNGQHGGSAAAGGGGAAT